MFCLWYISYQLKEEFEITKPSSSHTALHVVFKGPGTSPASTVILVVYKGPVTSSTSPVLLIVFNEPETLPTSADALHVV